MRKIVNRLFSNYMIYTDTSTIAGDDATQHIIIIIIIIIIAFIEIKLTTATCYNDTSNKLPRMTALHCIIEHKALLPAQSVSICTLRLLLKLQVAHNKQWLEIPLIVLKFISKKKLCSS